MEKFGFKQDVKVSVWIRQSFTIEAENKEEALKMVEQFKTEDVSGEILEIDSETLWDTAELLYPEDNGGNCTIELFDGDKSIGKNA